MKLKDFGSSFRGSWGLKEELYKYLKSENKDNQGQFNDLEFFRFAYILYYYFENMIHTINSESKI